MNKFTVSKMANYRGQVKVAQLQKVAELACY